MSRYIYEHWFLANLYFPGLDQGLHFKLVRSATPPGEAIEIIATRRPYDDPGVERVYYRFRRDHSTVLDKTNMPYALDAARLYMDFLRLESEFNFLALLPAEARQSEADHWYEGADEKQKAYIYGKRASFDNPTSIDYRTDNPKLEVYGMLQRRLTPVLNHSFDISAADVPPRYRATLERLAGLKGESLAMLPEMTVLNVTTADGPGKFYTILRNTAHSNITSLFSESKNLRPQENTLTVVRGFIGSYPNAYWRVSEQDLDGLPVAVASLTDEASYASFAARFGVRRTADDFWQQSDRVAAARQAYDPIANGLFDYNRLENR